ncbi:thermonuclease family protein [Amycolatopsis cihanbeyliensis]|nr:hypothetical protein [Amycolatopsis cihanbeyliensis]
MLFTLATICGLSTEKTHGSPAAKPAPAAVVPAKAATAPPAYPVTSVIDGGTVEVTGADGARRRITVRGLRAPSVDACFGTESFAWAAETLIGTKVTPRTSSGEPPGTVGTTDADLILPDGTNYAVAALDGGYASYVAADTPGAPVPPLQRAERTARSAEAGLWGPPCHGNAGGTSPATSASP